MKPQMASAQFVAAIGSGLWNGGGPVQYSNVIFEFSFLFVKLFTLIVENLVVDNLSMNFNYNFFKSVFVLRNFFFFNNK